MCLEVLIQRELGSLVASDDAVIGIWSQRSWRPVIHRTASARIWHSKQPRVGHRLLVGNEQHGWLSPHFQFHGQSLPGADVPSNHLGGKVRFFPQADRPEGEVESTSGEFCFGNLSRLSDRSGQVRKAVAARHVSWYCGKLFEKFTPFLFLNPITVLWSYISST